jgi:hypothetical protein
MHSRTRGTGTAIGLCALVFAAAGPVAAGVSPPTTRVRAPGTLLVVDQTQSGNTPNAGPNTVSVSANGRYLVYYTYATDIIPGGTPTNVGHIYLYDAKNDTTTLISHNNGGALSDDTSYFASISANGKFVVYESFANNLPGGANPTGPRIFRYNVETDKTVLVSKSPSGVPPKSYATAAGVSATGRFVVYSSRAHNIVPGDHNHAFDIFLWDSKTNTTSIVSKKVNGGPIDKYSSGASVSRDGRFISYSTLSRTMGPADTNGMSDSYVYDRQSDTTTLVSRGLDGEAGGGANPQISADGRFIAFDSPYALTANDAVANVDIFLYRISNGKIRLVSGNVPGRADNAGSQVPTISSDGGVIGFNVYTSFTPSAVPNVFLYNRTTHETTSITDGLSGGLADLGADAAHVTGNGLKVAFLGFSSTVSRPTEGDNGDVFLWTPAN